MLDRAEFYGRIEAARGIVPDELLDETIRRYEQQRIDMLNHEIGIEKFNARYRVLDDSQTGLILGAKMVDFEVDCDVTVMRRNQRD